MCKNKRVEVNGLRIIKGRSRHILSLWLFNLNEWSVKRINGRVLKVPCLIYDYNFVLWQIRSKFKKISWKILQVM